MANLIKNNSSKHAFATIDKVMLAVETAKHYGSMRFTMFTVFTTIAGAFLFFPFTEGGSAFLHRCGTECSFNAALLGWTGLFISALFVLAELRISWLVVIYQEKAFCPSLYPEPSGHKFWRLFIPFIMFMPAFICALFWALFLKGIIITPTFPVAR